MKIDTSKLTPAQLLTQVSCPTNYEGYERTNCKGTNCKMCVLYTFGYIKEEQLYDPILSFLWGNN